MKILVIGGGNMGLTYAKSFLRSKIVSEENMVILEKSLKKAEELEKLNIGTVKGEPGSYIQDCDLIILAVKPQDTSALFASIEPFISTQQVVMSIMAGVKIKTISAAIGTAKIIRTMPNLPAQIGTGMTIFTSSTEVTRIELVMVQNLLNSTGKTIYVDNETAIDAATAISGSGPAYIFYFMQSLIRSATHLGFTQAQSELMTYQTFKGAIELFNKFDYSCEEWIAKVSSRGGTTEAAFQEFNSHNVDDKFRNGVMAAFNRAKELSE